MSERGERINRHGAPDFVVYDTAAERDGAADLVAALRTDRAASGQARRRNRSCVEAPSSSA